jgi:hypothetical protein
LSTVAFSVFSSACYLPCHRRSLGTSSLCYSSNILWVLWVHSVRTSWFMGSLLRGPRTASVVLFFLVFLSVCIFTAALRPRVTFPFFCLPESLYFPHRAVLHPVVTWRTVSVVVPRAADWMSDLNLAVLRRSNPRFPQLRLCSFGTEEVPMIRLLTWHI